MCGCNEVCAGVYENVCTVFVSEHVWVSVCMNVGEFGCQNVYDLPTLVFLPGKSHGQRSLGGLQSMGS